MRLVICEGIRCREEGSGKIGLRRRRDEPSCWAGSEFIGQLALQVSTEDDVKFILHTNEMERRKLGWDGMRAYLLPTAL